MSMSIGERDDDAPMMEMNMTPLIDVLLVLLIMFIITIPPQTHAVKIDLPVPDDRPLDANVDPIKNKLTVDQNDVLAWNGTPITLDQLNVYLQQTKAYAVEPELQLQPHPEARYLIVDQVLESIKRNDVTKLGFVGNEQYGRVF